MNPFSLYGAIAYIQKVDFTEIVSSAILAFSKSNLQPCKFQVEYSGIIIIPCLSKKKDMNGFYNCAYPIELSRTIENICVSAKSKGYLFSIKEVNCLKSIIKIKLIKQTTIIL